MAFTARKFLPIIALLAFVPGARADFFVGGYYTPIAGKVGQPMISDAAFSVGDIPGDCLIAWQSISVTGDLPPGILAPGADDTLISPAQAVGPDGIPPVLADVPDVASSAFSGTPSKAGDWPVMVTFHGLNCSGPQNYGDRTIKVTFHIGP